MRLNGIPLVQSAYFFNFFKFNLCIIHFWLFRIFGWVTYKRFGVSGRQGERGTGEGGRYGEGGETMKERDTGKGERGKG